MHCDIFYWHCVNAGAVQNRELQIMRKLDHDNIVRLRYFFYSSGEKVTLKLLNYIIDIWHIWELPASTATPVSQCCGTKLLFSFFIVAEVLVSFDCANWAADWLRVLLILSPYDSLEYVNHECVHEHMNLKVGIWLIWLVFIQLHIFKNLKCFFWYKWYILAEIHTGGWASVCKPAWLSVNQDVISCNHWM